MKNVSTFQIVVLAVCIIVAIVGVAIFAGFAGGNSKSSPTAVIWGTEPSAYILDMVQNINVSSTVINVTYVQKDPATFENDLVNAIAEGTGPDAVLISDDMLYAEKNKLQPIPFTAFAQRDFLNTFIDGASIFVGQDGILGVPLSVDPLVMYYNKNILAASGVSEPPSSWNEMDAIAPQIIQRTDASDITQALVSFGGYSNVDHAKQILATLMFQLGNPISQTNPNTGAIYSVITADSNNASVSTKPIESVINYYTSFADPSNTNLYTWNLSMPDSQQAFLSGNLAFYFGFASELGTLQSKNPNLNFDVAPIPQDPGTLPAQYGQMTAFAIVKNIPNLAGVLTVISDLTTANSIAEWSKVSNLPPVRRDLLAQPPSDAYMSVFYKAAIQSQAWFDPDPAQTDAALQDMIESVTTGRKKVEAAITDVGQIFDQLYGTSN